MRAKSAASNVQIAIALMLASVALAVFRAAIDPSMPPSGDVPESLMWAIRIVSYLLYFGLFYLIYRGRNWARVLYLMFFVLGVPFFDYASLGDSPLRWIVFAAQFVLGTVALILLFLPSTREYFRPSTVPPAV